MKFGWIILCCLLFYSCQGPPHPSFAGAYWWKGTWDFSAEDGKLLAQAGVGRLYVRLFDWDLRFGKLGDRGPLSPLPTLNQGAPAWPQGLEAVPTVYVTTAALGAWAERYKKDPASASPLAQDLVRRMTQVWALNLKNLPFPLVQIDADWNAGTRQGYFAVLAEVRKILANQKVKLSVTIRLHQYRDRDNQGVPPADEGVLMVYGASDPTVMAPEPTVLDLPLVRAYLKGPAYPFPLSLGVPLYAQTRQFNPYGRFVAQVRTPLFTDLARFPQDFRLSPAQDGWWEALHRREWSGALVMEHDLVRVDGVTEADLESLKKLAQERIRMDRADSVPGTVFFDYDREEWKRSDHEKLRRVFDGY